MDRLARIAARVAGAQVQLQGPFEKKTSPQHSYNIDLPFGLTGAIVPLLVQAWGEDPKNLNISQAIEQGPNPDVSIGYKVVRENLTSESYELELQLTHIEGYDLSPTDQATLEKMGIGQLLYDRVEEDHMARAQEHAADEKRRFPEREDF
jgi:hypothetical protein